MQFADESAGEIRLAGIVIDKAMDAIAYMEETLPPGSIINIELSGESYYIWMDTPHAYDTGEVRHNTLNALLVASGYAAASGDPAEKYTDILTACQEEARAACIGLWAVALETTAAPGLTPASVLTPIPAPPSPQEIEQATDPVPEELPLKPPPGGVYYCGSKNSDVFHLSTCGERKPDQPGEPGDLHLQGGCDQPRKEALQEMQSVV